LVDLSGREGLVLGILVCAVLWLGLWPDPLVQLMEPSIHQWVGIIAAPSRLAVQ